MMCLSDLKSIFHIETTDRDSVPKLYQEFNIQTGYRIPYRQWKYYFKSIYKIHNETINVWSHTLGALIILWYLVSFCQRNMDHHPFSCHIMVTFGIASISVHLFSALAHLIHNKDDDVHCAIFFCDNAFASIGAYCESLSGFYFLAEPEFYERMEFVNIELLLIFSIIMSFTFNYALARYKRHYNRSTAIWMFVPTTAFMIFGLQPIVHKLLKFSLFDLFSDSHLYNHFVHVITIILGTVFYTSSIPERFFKGCFDIVGHSHQIFHILYTLSHCFYFNAVQSDIDSNYSNLPERRLPHHKISTFYISLFGLQLFNIALIIFFVHLNRVHKDVWQKEKSLPQNEKSN